MRRPNYLAWAIAILSCLSARAEPPPSLARIHADTVMILNDINVAHLEGLERCLCEITRSEIDSCKAYESTRIDFAQMVLNIAGNVHISEISCGEAIHRLLRNRIRMSYREMARALAKREPARREHPALAERLDWSARTHWHPSPSHPVNSLWLSNLPIRSPALDRDDYLFLRNAYREASEKYCRDFTALPNLQERIAFASRQLAGANLCEVLLGLLPDHRHRRSLQSDFSDYYSYAAGRRNREFRAPAEREYLDKVNRNPILLFLKNDSPTDPELLEAVSEVARLARARKQNLLAVHAAATQDSDLAEFTRIEAALPYTRARARALGIDPEIFAPTFASWSQEKADHEFNRQMGEISVGVGLLAVCFSPWGRIVGAAAAVIVRSVCLTGIGIPLNTYFLWDAWDHYHEALELALSSIEPGQQFSSFRQIESARSKINLIAVLFPLGLNLKSARESVAALRAAFSH